jgi:signal transduction histidine kinase
VRRHSALLSAGLCASRARLGLFERFRRGRAASAFPGSGLGLAVVRATAELHGGSVSANSDGTRGARFELILPLISPDRV